MLHIGIGTLALPPIVARGGASILSPENVRIKHAKEPPSLHYQQRSFRVERLVTRDAPPTDVSSSSECDHEDAASPIPVSLPTHVHMDLERGVYWCVRCKPMDLPKHGMSMTGNGVADVFQVGAVRD